MKLALICAMADNRVIGRNNNLPWHLAEDLKYFKRVTMGNCIIMGRKTWESIGRVLPGRTNIVVTANPDYLAEGVRVVHSLEEALSLAESISEIDGSEEAFIIGGAGLYQTALPMAQRFHLTRVHADVEGDTYLAEFDQSQWREISRQEFQKSDTNPYDYSICLLERINGVGDT
ncbi:MAG TPA: dihydrofolate reductase [Gammaproteobacteria bacterium]|nr:dihydrofolate reductase [Gammaproteobacteria bacterium]MDP6732380.1 dihydrofolate reductase [Gammaproteobacteria bacterium]HAJ77201.1 dihydrofolate reductase [Gammaproteobacteria bacterium]